MYAKITGFLSRIFSERNITILAALSAIFLTSGGIYLIVARPGALVSGGSSLAQSSMTQTSTEFFTVFFLTLAGMAGFYILERAMQRTFDISGAKMKYLVAIILVLMAIVIMEYMLNYKIGIY